MNENSLSAIRLIDLTQQLATLVEAAPFSSIQTPERIIGNEVQCLGVPSKAGGEQFFRLIKRREDVGDAGDFLFELREVNGQPVLIDHRKLSGLEKGEKTTQAIISLANVSVGERVIIGRGQEKGANVPIADDSLSKVVSGRHLELWHDILGQWFIRNPGVLNEPYINLRQLEGAKRQAPQPVISREAVAVASEERLDSSGEVEITFIKKGSDKKELQHSICNLNLKVGEKRYEIGIEMASSIGERDVDEDFVGVLEFVVKGDPEQRKLGLAAVWDGMGGHSAGDLASGLGWEAASKAAQDKIIYKDGQFWWGGEALGNDLEGKTGKTIISLLVQEANTAVYEFNQQGHDSGTTVVAALMIGENAHIGHVGDSRAYHKDADGKLSLLTVDHSLVAVRLADGKHDGKPYGVEEAREDRQGNVIYRVLGNELKVKVDIISVKLAKGEGLLLVCDGPPEAFDEEYLNKGEVPVKMQGALKKGGVRGLITEAVQSEKCNDNCSALELKLMNVVEARSDSEQLKADLLRLFGEAGGKIDEERGEVLTKELIRVLADVSDLVRGGTSPEWLSPKVKSGIFDFIAKCATMEQKGKIIDIMLR